MASSGLSAEEAAYREEGDMSGVTFPRAREAWLLARWYRECAPSRGDAAQQSGTSRVLVLGMMETIEVLLGLFGEGAGKCSGEELNKLWSPEACADGLQFLG